MDELRLGDIIDDYCIKCRRMTNHAIVSIVETQAAKVRCRSCYHDHTYLHEQIPPSKKDLKKMELFNAVLAGSGLAAPKDESDAVDSISESDSPEGDREESQGGPQKPARSKKA